MIATRKALAAVTAVGVALFLASCASVGSGGTAPNGAVGWDGVLDLGVPGEVHEVHQDVEFYPACGNETLIWDATAYYPYEPAQLDEFPDPTDVVTRASALETHVAPGWARMSVMLPAVPMPEPGDDVGTLVIYEGEHAYWESNNGALATWLTTAELEYGWVC